MRNASRNVDLLPMNLKPTIVGLDVTEPGSEFESRLAWFEYQRSTAELHRLWARMLKEQMLREQREEKERLRVAGRLRTLEECDALASKHVSDWIDTEVLLTAVTEAGDSKHG